MLVYAIPNYLYNELFPYNNELFPFQLRIHDLESALNLEKAAKTEAVLKSEKMSQQVM